MVLRQLVQVAVEIEKGYSEVGCTYCPTIGEIGWRTSRSQHLLSARVLVSPHSLDLTRLSEVPSLVTSGSASTSQTHADASKHGETSAVVPPKSRGLGPSRARLFMTF
ncbi:hypothetical protein PILCRDRAFT_825578 [Piloderma croceum F 1598]|uniref:Uncharacterized protein n=1 Tax=Piloderma croceum (strain F 1598) TaxID=765440 RepID=A0A0C3BIP7_PILCF|nr:hypothetical protein PILCRDRAFT_825578 [Piloderma croceum F 1598]